MKPSLRIYLPLLVLILCASIGYMLIETGPQVERRPTVKPLPVVEALTVERTTHQVTLRSRGTVSPHTESLLIPEISGRIIDIADEFRNGGFFEQGQLLVRIDPTDYRNALTIALAELAQARLALREEEALAEQARMDWERLAINGEPNDLVLRVPQLDSAKAGVAAAEARLRQAESDLERTEIRAPYAGRILEKMADRGQFVTQGTSLARLYAVDYAEIRLPLTDRQIAFLDLPIAFRGEPAPAIWPKVEVSANIGGQIHRWDGRITRTEGAIDTQSRQLFAIAQVNNPYGRRANGQPPLMIGQFVEASISGRLLEAVIALPRSALVGHDGLLVITPDDRIEHRRVDIIWQDGDTAYLMDGIAPGERISLTRLPFAVDGTPVRVHEPAEIDIGTGN